MWYGQGVGVEEPCEEIGSRCLVQNGKDHTFQYLLSLLLFFLNIKGVAGEHEGDQVEDWVV